MVPTLGESVTEATVSTWFKAVGDAVAQDEMLCELETDKVSVEVPAPAAGVLAEIVAPEGSTVDASAKLAVIWLLRRRRRARGCQRLPPHLQRLLPPPLARTSRTHRPRKKPWPKLASAPIRSPAQAVTAAS